MTIIGVWLGENLPNISRVGFIHGLTSVLGIQSPITRSFEEINLIVFPPDNGSIRVIGNSRKSCRNRSRKSRVNLTVTRSPPVLRSLEEIDLPVGPRESGVQIVWNSRPVVRYLPGKPGLESTSLVQYPVLLILRSDFITAE